MSGKLLALPAVAEHGRERQHRAVTTGKGTSCLGNVRGFEVVRGATHRPNVLAVCAAHDGGYGRRCIQPVSTKCGLQVPSDDCSSSWRGGLSAPSPLQSATCIRSSSGVSENGSLATSQPRPRPSTMLRTGMMADFEQLTDLKI